MRDRPNGMTRNLEKQIVELSKLMGCDTRISTPTNGSTSDERHDVIKRRGLNVWVHNLLYQRYTKSRDHYNKTNDMLFTPYLTPPILSVGIIGVDKEVRIELSNQGSQKRILDPKSGNQLLRSKFLCIFRSNSSSMTVKLLIGFLVFLSSKPITLESRGRGGGFLCSCLPNHDAKGWKGKKDKNKNKKKNKINKDRLH